jgi:hypothetical protein
MSKKKIEEQVKKRVKGEARKKVQKQAFLDDQGREILDERPLFHDLGFKQPESLNDKIRRITAQVQAETAAKFAAQNMSDEEILRILDEEDDFEIPEDFDNAMTQYEARGMLSELEENVSINIPPAEQADGEAVQDDPEGIAAKRSEAVAEEA